LEELVELLVDKLGRWEVIEEGAGELDVLGRGFGGPLELVSQKIAEAQGQERLAVGKLTFRP